MALRSSLVTSLRAALCLAVLPIGLLLYSAWAVLLALLGAPRQRIDRVYTGFADLGLRTAGTSLHVRGRENVKPDQSYVVVANHESNWDPVGLLAALRDLSVRFVIKRQIIRFPVFGRALMLTGNVKVERDKTRTDVKRVREGMQSRAPEVSMLFYAEGTRGREGAFRPFRKGAFVSAIRFGLPILPVGHAGAYYIWKPLTWIVRKGAMAIEIGAPIPVDGLAVQDREKLRDDTRKAVGELRYRARARVRELGAEPGGID